MYLGNHSPDMGRGGAGVKKEGWINGVQRRNGFLRLEHRAVISEIVDPISSMGMDLLENVTASFGGVDQQY